MDSPVPERQHIFDSAKFVLILLVVVGHMLERHPSLTPLYKSVYLWIYTFHMPLFVFITGHFSKIIPTEHSRRATIHLLSVYVVFQLLYTLFHIYYLGESTTLNDLLIKPYWILWFLLCVFWWRLLLPYLSLAKFPVVAALAIGLLAGYSKQTGYYLSLARMCTFLPFFVLGYYTSYESILRLRAHVTMKLVGIVVLLLSVYGVYLFRDSIDVRWLYGSYAYADKLGYTATIRLLFYVYATAIGTALLAVLPTWHWLCRMGERTLYPYVLHGFVVLALSKGHLIGSMSNTQTVVVACAIGVVLLAIQQFIPVKAEK